MSTASISGLSSGIDWQGMIDQLREVEYNRVKLIEQEKATHQSKLEAWQGINTKLLSLKTAADELNARSDFNLFTTSLTSSSDTDASDLLSASAGEDASPGTYDIVVNSVASAQKLSSGSYSSATTELGLSGDIVVGGRSVNISTTDTLNGIREKINAVNTGTDASGVTASIVDYGTEGVRLILTSDEAGADGIQILNGGSADLLGSLGFVDASAKTAKNAVAGGHRSDAMAYADRAVGGSDVLNLTSAQTGTVDITINGTTQSVAVDLSTDSLNDIRDAINTAFSGTFTSDPASVVSETDDDGTTAYRLLIEGLSITYTDSNNVLETLGVLERAGVSDVRGMTGDVANTASGAAITGATTFDAVDGYIDVGASDTITLSGTDTNGAAVNTVFSVHDGSAYKTLDDLLTEIETAFGSVTASITSDGRIRVQDDEISDTDLSVVLTPSNSSLSLDSDNDLGAIDTLRKRELQAGSNAEITVDGVTVTPSSNTVDDVIEGVTLNLKEAEAGTTVTLNVARDNEAVLEKIQGFVDAYNEVIGAIKAQTSYDEESGAGGPLFGDASLRTLRSTLSSIVLNKVSGVSDNFSTLGLVGISVGADSKLSVDQTELGDYLETNFEDVRSLFATDWSSTNSHITYGYHTDDTLAGTYNVNITGVSPLDGYFESTGDAEASGTYLKGISGDVEGLRIGYSGTATGNVGTFTLTYGVAELFNRTLEDLTDSTDGFVANKEESIQGTVERLDDRMADMEDRIEREMQTMTQQFIAMENTMRALQSQSSWLSSQIGTLSSGWR